MQCCKQKLIANICCKQKMTTNNLPSKNSRLVANICDAMLQRRVYVHNSTRYHRERENGWFKIRVSKSPALNQVTNNNTNSSNCFLYDLIIIKQLSYIKVHLFPCIRVRHIWKHFSFVEMKIEYIDNIFSIKPQHFLMHVSSYPFCFHSSTKKLTLLLQECSS